MQKKEAASEIYANREYKMKQKEELDREKQEVRLMRKMGHTIIIGTSGIRENEDLQSVGITISWCSQGKRLLQQQIRKVHAFLCVCHR